MELTLNVTLLTALIALLLTGGIFLFAFQAFLLKGVHAMLTAKIDPLKENQERIEKDLNQFKTEVNAKFKEANNRFEEVNNKLDNKLAEVHTKLDKLLSK